MVFLQYAMFMQSLYMDHAELMHLLCMLCTGSFALSFCEGHAI